MANKEEVMEIKQSMEEEVVEKEEVEIMQSIKDEGNYVATTPLATMIYNLCGSSSSPKDCLAEEYILDGHMINEEEDVNLGSNSITSCANILDVQNVEQSLVIVAGELRDARFMTMDGKNPTTTCLHKVKDRVLKGNYLLQVANVIETATPNALCSFPSIAIDHDIMNPMLYPESLEVVAIALQQGSDGKKNMSQLVHFLHLLAGDLLDITT